MDSYTLTNEISPSFRYSLFLWHSALLYQVNAEEFRYSAVGLVTSTTPTLLVSPHCASRNSDLMRSKTPDDVGAEVGNTVVLKILPQLYHHCDVGDVTLICSGVIEAAMTDNDGDSVPLIAKAVTPVHSL